MAADLRDKALIVTRNFPPLTGGMERLTLHTYNALRERYDCALIGPAGCREFVTHETPVSECQLKPLPRFLLEAWINGRKMARAYRPNIVFAASGLTSPIALSIARKHNAAAVTVVHGLDLVVPHPVYQKFFLPAIRQSDLVIANSANTARLARDAGVCADKIEVLHPGVSLPASITGPVMPTDGLNRRHVLLSVGRLVPRKGLAEFVDRALPSLVKHDPSIMLIIAGGEALDALKRDSRVLANVKSAIEKNYLHKHVCLLGRISDDSALDNLYRSSDVFVMPLIRKRDDVEGFGMVAVEAAARGLPTAGFNVDGLSDAVKNGRSGLLVQPDNYEALIYAILNLLSPTNSTGITATTCRAHAESFAWQRYNNRLLEILKTAKVSE
ncbi:MAG TPA: glycosyltransferase family 4 protein [Gammaproteobacteria bacterium]|nr:glycosyltransferase family 4 protein [Gammaproteobacteria bacterium]